MLTTLSIRNGRIPPGEVHQQFHPAQVQRLPNSINRYFYGVLEKTPGLNPLKESKNLRKHKNCVL